MKFHKLTIHKLWHKKHEWWNVKRFWSGYLGQEIRTTQRCNICGDERFQTGTVNANGVFIEGPPMSKREIMLRETVRKWMET